MQLILHKARLLLKAYFIGVTKYAAEQHIRKELITICWDFITLVCY